MSLSADGRPAAVAAGLVLGRRLRRSGDRHRLDRRHVLGPALRRHRPGSLRPRGHRRPDGRSRDPGREGRHQGRRVHPGNRPPHRLHELRRLGGAAPPQDRRERQLPRPSTAPAPGAPASPRAGSSETYGSSSPPRGLAEGPTSMRSSSVSSSSSSVSSSSSACPQERSARIFFLLCVLFLLFFVCRLRPASYWWIDVFVQSTGTVSLFLMPAVFLHFFLIFPRPKRLHFARADEWTGEPPARWKAAAAGVPVGKPRAALSPLRDSADRLPLRRDAPGAGREGHGALGGAALLVDPPRGLSRPRPRRPGALRVHAARTRASAARLSTSSSGRFWGRCPSSCSSSSCLRRSASTSTPSTGSSR